MPGIFFYGTKCRCTGSCKRIESLKSISVLRLLLSEVMSQHGIFFQRTSEFGCREYETSAVIFASFKTFEMSESTTCKMSD